MIILDLVSVHDDTKDVAEVDYPFFAREHAKNALDPRMRNVWIWKTGDLIVWENLNEENVESVITDVDGEWRMIVQERVANVVNSIDRGHFLRENLFLANLSEFDQQFLRNWFFGCLLKIHFSL